MRVFSKNISKNLQLSPILKKNASIKGAVVKNASIFYASKLQIQCEYFVRDKNFGKASILQVFLRAFETWRGLLLQAFQNFGDKKASKGGLLQIEKSEEKKKPMGQTKFTPMLTILQRAE